MTLKRNKRQHYADDVVRIYSEHIRSFYDNGNFDVHAVQYYVFVIDSFRYSFLVPFTEFMSQGEDPREKIRSANKGTVEDIERTWHKRKQLTAKREYARMQASQKENK